MFDEGKIYEEFIRRLEQVNDETLPPEEHEKAHVSLRGWLDGVELATGMTFNGDYYYIEKIDAGEMQQRPMCMGLFLDWQHKPTTA